MPTVRIGGAPLTVSVLDAIAAGHARAVLEPAAQRRMTAGARRAQRAISRRRPIYGLNTGVGSFAEVPLDEAQRGALQLNLLRSHAAGAGEPLPAEVVRALLALKAHTLAQGRSGVRPHVARALLRLLDRGVVPQVPDRGSLGASGDLAPLAHLALVLVGEGSARTADGRLRGGRAALAAAGLSPLVLEGREGIALINGTQVMTALTALAVAQARRVVTAQRAAAAMALEAMGCSDNFLTAALHEARPFRGQIETARLLRRWVEGSTLLGRAGRVQESYSLRCMPQVLAPVLDGLAFIESQLQTELNAASDNPLAVGPGGSFVSGGNFHGQSIAAAADHLSLLGATLCNLSERQINRLLNAHLSGLPPFLVEHQAGLNSGLMVAQYTAAALTAESRALAHPSSVDTISVSADQEDLVPMGMGAALHCRTVIGHATTVVAIHLLVAAQALEIHQRSSPTARTARGTRAALRAIRKVAPPMTTDRVVSTDIAALRRLIDSGSFLTLESRLSASRRHGREASARKASESTR